MYKPNFNDGDKVMIRCPSCKDKERCLGWTGGYELALEVTVRQNIDGSSLSQVSILYGDRRGERIELIHKYCLMRARP